MLAAQTTVHRLATWTHHCLKTMMNFASCGTFHDECVFSGRHTHADGLITADRNIDIVDILHVSKYNMSYQLNWKFHSFHKVLKLKFSVSSCNVVQIPLEKRSKEMAGWWFNLKHNLKDFNQNLGVLKKMFRRIREQFQPKVPVVVCRN